MKNRISLNESQLRRIIKRSLLEAMSSLSDDDRKREENFQSWRDIDNMPGYYHYDQTKGGKGYADEYDIPDEELEMYQSMGNPSQYATKGENQKYVRNKSGYGMHHSPERYDNGHLSIAAQSEPRTFNDLYGDNDYDEAGVSYKSGNDGRNYSTTTSSYARNPENFRGNQDMHDLESDRINRQNFDAEHEFDYLNHIDESRLNQIVSKVVKKHIK